MVSTETEHRHKLLEILFDNDVSDTIL